MVTVTISLPDQIAKMVDFETQKAGYATRSEFIRTVIRSYFTRQNAFQPFTPMPLHQIKKGLEKTGKYNARFIRSVVKGLSRSSLYVHQAPQN